jgi:hypothetical protein
MRLCQNIQARARERTPKAREITHELAWDDTVTVRARSVVYPVLENGARDGTGFHTILGPGCSFECGIEDVSYSNSLLGLNMC